MTTRCRFNKRLLSPCHFRIVIKRLTLMAMLSGKVFKHIKSSHSRGLLRALLSIRTRPWPLWIKWCRIEGYKRGPSSHSIWMILLCLGRLTLSWISFIATALERSWDRSTPGTHQWDCLDLIQGTRMCITICHCQLPLEMMSWSTTNSCSLSRLLPSPWYTNATLTSMR